MNVEKQTRTWRSRFEGVSEDLNYNVLPDAARHCAWQMTHRHVRSDGKKQIERLRGRPSRGQVTEFDEVDHFRETQRAAGSSKLCDEGSLRLWMEQIWVSDGHCRGTPTRVRRCRSIWKCREDLSHSGQLPLSQREHPEKKDNYKSTTTTSSVVGNLEKFKTAVRLPERW